MAKRQVREVERLKVENLWPQSQRRKTMKSEWVLEDSQSRISRQTGWGCAGLQAKEGWHHKRGRIKWKINKFGDHKEKEKTDSCLDVGIKRQWKWHVKNIYDDKRSLNDFRRIKYIRLYFCSIVQSYIQYYQFKLTKWDCLVEFVTCPVVSLLCLRQRTKIWTDGGWSVHF